MSRPYINCSVFELQTLVTQNREDKTVLSTILTELNNRTTPSSRALKEEVRRLLGLSQDLLTPPASFGPGSLLREPAAPIPATVASQPAPGIDLPDRPSEPREPAPTPAAVVEATLASPPPPVSPPDLPEPEALALLKLDGPQSWVNVEEQRRKLVLGILAQRGENRIVSEEAKMNIRFINAAAKSVFNSRRHH